MFSVSCSSGSVKAAVMSQYELAQWWNIADITVSRPQLHLESLTSVHRVSVVQSAVWNQLLDSACNATISQKKTPSCQCPAHTGNGLLQIQARYRLEEEACLCFVQTTDPFGIKSCQHGIRKSNYVQTRKTLLYSFSTFTGFLQRAKIYE